MMEQLKSLLGNDSQDDGKKKLSINCGEALLFSDREGFLDGFDRISLNCGSLFASSKVYAALMAKGANINSGTNSIREIKGEVLRLDGGEVGKGMDFTDKFVVCMGDLILKEGGAQALAGAEGVYVTGSLFYPQEDGRALLSKVTGETIAYPAGSHLLIGDYKLAEILHGIAKEGKNHVFVHGEINAMEEKSLAKAQEKNISFVCKSLFSMESYFDTYGALFHAEQHILVPDGYEAAPEMTLTAGEAALYGPRIFVKGDLLLQKKDAACLGELEALIVTGTATIPTSSAKQFRAIGKAERYELIPDDVDGVMEVNGFQTIGHGYLQALLAKNETVAIEVNGALLFNEDVTADDIAAIATIEINGMVLMPDAAQGVLAAKATAINGTLLTIETITGLSGLSLPETLAKLQGGGSGGNNTNVNAGSYVLV